MSDQEKLSNQEESHVDAKTIANRKKREKKKAKAAAAATEGGKKMSAAAKLAAARLEAAREAEEERKRLEEEAQKKAEEEERLAAEEARKAQEEKERKAAEKKARRERLRAEGKLLSKKEKEQKAKADAYRQMLLESGQLPAAVTASDEDSTTDKPKKQSDLYGKKKSHKHKKQPSRGELVEERVVSTTHDDDDDDWEKAEEVVDKKSESEAESVDDWELLDEDSDDDKKVEAYPTHVKNKPQKKEEVDVKGKFAAADPLAVFDSSTSEFRSPICCIMGHVDTGKTKLLDKIRRTTVQEGEAGGITQQIGATFFPEASLQDAVHKVNLTTYLQLPGLLIIDTPGHESFNNLRVRGSSLCDIAILVVDIMHGLEPQTIESLELLRNRKCPFIIALNKIDRLYQWRSSANRPSRDSLKAQKDYVKHEFDDRLKRIQLQLAERGLNTAVYWENHDVRRDVSIVPTSAVTGEGVPDLLYLIVKLTQTLMAKKITRQPDLFQCTVLEVKNIEGLGTTIDVILVNGRIKETDQICVCTLAGPVVTTIRALLTPPPAKEIRVKSEYVHHKVIN
ncbi:eukaryotic translation initiation factor 5B, putative, partial [Perkinsus marinus ATCC 50983]